MDWGAWGPSIVSALGAIGGGVIQSSGAKGAASTAARASERAGDVAMEMYQQSRDDLAPWREAGEEALNALTQKIEAGPGEFRQSPSYQFVRGEGLDAMNQTLANMGLSQSGGHAQAAGEYASNLADAEYDNFLRRFYQSLTPYQSLAGVGQTAGSQLGANALGTGQIAGQNIADAGAYRAGGQMGAANTLANLTNWGAQQISDYAAENALRNRLQAPAVTPTAGGYYYDMPSGQTPWWGYY